MKYKFFIIVLLLVSKLYSQEKVISKSLTEQKIEEYLNKSFELIGENLDSALLYNKMAEDLIQRLPKNTNQVILFKNLGNVYLEKGNFTIALDYLLKAARIVEEQLLKNPGNQSYIQSKIDLLVLIGNLELRQNNYDQALSFYNRANSILEKVKNKNKSLLLRITILNNKASVFSKKRDFKKALPYYESVRKLNSTLGNKKLEATILNNIGICHIENGEYATAIFVLKEALTIRKNIGNQREIAQCYNNLGKVFALQKNYTKAQIFFDEALKIGRKVGNSESILHSLESLRILHELTNDDKLAYRYLKELTDLKDSLFNEQSVKQMTQLELNYKLDKQKSIYNAELRNKEIEKQGNKILYYSVAGGLLCILAISILWIYLQKSKIKNINLSKEKLELEHKNTLLEKEYLKEELELKNREMTTKMMYLFKKNELINTVAEKLSELKKKVLPENKRAIQELIVEMRQKKDDNIWNEFETYFIKVNPEFYSKLNQLFPDLTPNEKKLCAFLRLNMSTKDISSITYQSVNSIAVSRSRLRKKLNIQGEDKNLINFLSDI
ncbi:tetratricopeptide repeat protein [Empedobacter brevis]|uniref:tetratricopeptide repeat protein n=1 Tax=Empedobacter brevis TaxID=247 RepID=UPI002FE311EC